jgi:hypothetical protein
MNVMTEVYTHRHAKWSRLALLLAILLLAPQGAMAAFDLSWRPQLRLGTRATDNLRTAIDNPEAAWGFDMGGGVQLDLQSNSLRSRITPAFNFRRFAIGEGADADEYEVRTSTQWAFVDRATASLDFDYIRDSTLSTELTDTGRQTAVANRDTINVAPSVVVLITESTSLNLGFYYSDVEFEQLPGTPFSDYDFKQVSATLTQALSDRLSVFANAYVSEFRTPSSGTESLTYGGLGGVSYRYSDTLQGEFGVGYVQSEIDFLAQETVPGQFQFVVDPNTGQIILLPVLITTKQSAVENGPIARANIEKQWSSATRTLLTYDRSVSPTVFGAQSASDDLGISLVHQVSPRLRASVRARYNLRSVESDSITARRGNLDRDQVVLGTALRFQWSRQIAIEANYRFVRNDLAALDARSYNNGLFITFIYQGEPNFYRGF